MTLPRIAVTAGEPAGIGPDILLQAAQQEWPSASLKAIDGIDAARSSQDLRPARGISMDRVEAQFGPPTMRQAAVGDPPIERWDYPGFAVYFEYEYVIHTVVTP